MLAHQAGEVRAADLLLGLEQEAEVDRRGRGRRAEHVRRPDGGGEPGPFVAGAPPPEGPRAARGARVRGAGVQGDRVAEPLALPGERGAVHGVGAVVVHAVAGLVRVGGTAGRAAVVEHMQHLQSAIDVLAEAAKSDKNAAAEKARLHIELALTLRRARKPIDGDFDVIFLDCPPNLGLLTVNALVAARGRLMGALPAGARFVQP